MCFLNGFFSCWEGCLKVVYRGYLVIFISILDIKVVIRVVVFIIIELTDYIGFMLRLFIYNGMVYKVNRL